LQADQPATATTSPSFAAAEPAREPVLHKLNRRAHARELSDAASDVVGAFAARSLHRTKFWQRRLNGPAPDRILVNPRCFHRKSMAEAELLIMGRFRLPGGDATARDGSPFFIQAPSELWSESLHSFHWLRHFDAGGSDPVQEHLRQLIAHWVRAYGNWHELAWRPHVLARRLVTWASFGRLILHNADVLFRSRVLLSMARQARHLSKTARTAAPGMPRLTAAIGLAQSGVCLPDGEARMNRGLHMLAEELGDQVLPDGGHVSRNPEHVLAIASDLLALMDSMTQRDLIVPVAIRRALERMMPMIRFMQHGDGRLALFNGGTESSDGWAHALLTYDSGRNKTQLCQACGYNRIVSGRTLLVADTGLAPKGLLSIGAHAGCLSFELSAGDERIIVNCGASLIQGRALDASDARDRRALGADRRRLIVRPRRCRAMGRAPFGCAPCRRPDARRGQKARERRRHPSRREPRRLSRALRPHPRAPLVRLARRQRHPRRRSSGAERGKRGPANLRRPLPFAPDGQGDALARRARDRAHLAERRHLALRRGQPSRHRRKRLSRHGRCHPQNPADLDCGYDRRRTCGGEMGAQEDRGPSVLLIFNRLPAG
jgi:hypothetical protein